MSHSAIPTRLFFKYDDAGPRPLRGTARSHALPNAVPIARTIPIEHAEDKSYHLAQRKNFTGPPSFILPRVPSTKYNWNHSYHDDFRTLYLYNPSILPLHNTVKKRDKDKMGSGEDTYYDNDQYFEDPDALSEEDLMALTGGDPSVRYISTFRAYLGCNCFGRNATDRRLMSSGEQISYLAIALLNETLDVVDGTDVLIDLNAGPSRGQYGRQFVEDCRVSLMRGGLYLICNQELKRIRIERTMTHNAPSSSSSRPLRQLPPPGYGTKRGIPLPYVYPNIHGFGLNVTLLSHHTGISGGKNFNLFRSTRKSHESGANNGNTNTSAVGLIHDHYLQLLPHPHKYRKLNVPDGRDSNFDNVLDAKHDPVTKKKIEEETAPQVGGLPKMTFDTPDTFHKISKCPAPPIDMDSLEQTKLRMNCTDPLEVPFFEVEDDHGTACCVRVVLPLDANAAPNSLGRGREVMVGISHQKTSARSNFWLLDVRRRYLDFGIDRFVSRFVAYNSHHPFDIVARSGWFCLGFADDPIELSHPQRSTLAGQNKEFRLDLFDDLYNCPTIHFPSGFSEVVGNSSRAIIGYGVNDCHPRMFVVEKDEIVRMLTMS